MRNPSTPQTPCQRCGHTLIDHVTGCTVKGCSCPRFRKNKSAGRPREHGTCWGCPAEDVPYYSQYNAFLCLECLSIAMDWDENVNLKRRKR